MEANPTRHPLPCGLCGASARRAQRANKKVARPHIAALCAHTTCALEIELARG